MNLEPLGKRGASTMSTCTIVDTFPDFLQYWEHAQNRSLEEKIDSWQSGYMRKWPELLHKQQASYGNNSEWLPIARERVFPFLGERLPWMRAAHEILPGACKTIHSRASSLLSLHLDLTCVLYVGIGCGAGWGTTYGNAPALLFGLEMIAECGWSEKSILHGLVAHELGHVAQQHWRSEAGKADESGPWWELYTEGFAQRCEHVMIGSQTWHQSRGINPPDWVSWCQDHRGYLAREFLRRVDCGESVAPFFGSWLELDGRRECGYFLGHEVIAEMQKQTDLKAIALMSDVEPACRAVLEKFALGS